MFTPDQSSVKGGGGRTATSNSKRKRDQESFSTKRINKSPLIVEPKARMRTVRKVDAIARSLGENSQNRQVGNAFVPAGHFLCIFEDRALYFPEVHISTASTGISLTSDDFDFSETCLGVICFDDSSTRKHVFCIDHDGKVLARTILSNGTVQNVSDPPFAILKFDDPEERPCTIASRECHVLIGTTHGSIHLISRSSGGSWSVERFQKNRNVIFGILRSGAKLLGLAPGVEVSSKILKICPIRSDVLAAGTGSLAVVSTTSLDLWSNWNKIGAEKLLWSVPLSNILEDDVSSMLGVFMGRVNVLDAILMPIVGEDDVELGLILLSSCKVLSTLESSGHERYNLFLHYMEFSSSSPPGRSKQRAALAMSIDDYTQFPHQAWPHLHSEIPGKSLSMTATWIANRSMKASQFDLNCFDYILDGPESIDPPHIVEVLSAQESSCPFVDTDVSADQVLAAGPMYGVQGVGILSQDGHLTMMSLPAPGRLSGRQNIILTNKKMSKFLSRFNPSVEYSQALENLVRDIAKGEDRDLDNTRICVQVLSSILMQISRHLNIPDADDVVSAELGKVSKSVSKEFTDRESRLGDSLAHQLLRHNVNCHLRLTAVLTEMRKDQGEWIKENDLNTVLSNNELLLGGMSFCESYQTIQSEDLSKEVERSEGVPEDARFFLDQARIYGGNALRRGIDEALFKRSRSISGLSSDDVFFGNVSQIPSGLIEIASFLSSHREHGVKLFPAAYGVLSVFHSYLLLGADRENVHWLPSSISFQDGDHRGFTLLLCNPDVRKAVLEVMTVARDGAEIFFSDANVSKGFRSDREGSKVKELCSAVLKGYYLQAAVFADSSLTLKKAYDAVDSQTLESGSVLLKSCKDPAILCDNGAWKSGKEFREEYYQALDICTSLLLEIGCEEEGTLASAAFTLSMIHSYALGLMRATDLQRDHLLPLLEMYLEKRGENIGASEKQVALECLSFLEGTPTQPDGIGHRTDEILSLAKFIPSHLFDDFISRRPHLSWLYNMRYRKYDQAAEDALSFANNVDCPTVKHLKSSLAILSIAKLCAHAAKSSNCVDSSKCSSSIYRGLLEIRAQECLMHTQEIFEPSRVCMEPFKLNANVITEQMINLLKTKLSNPGTFPSVIPNTFEFVNLILCLLSEKITSCEERGEMLDIEDFKKKFTDVWAGVICADFLLVDLIQYERDGLASVDIENRLRGGHEGFPSSLLFRIIRANSVEVHEGRLKDNVLLTVKSSGEVTDAAARDLGIENASDVNALKSMVCKSLDLVSAVR